MNKKNCATKVVDYIYNYIIIVYNLLFHKEKMLKLIINKNIKFPIEENAFLIINIIIMEAVALINDMIWKNYISIFSNIPISITIGYIENLPIKYGLDIITRIVGMVLLVMVLVKILKANDKIYIIKPMVFYFSIYLLLIYIVAMLLKGLFYQIIINTLDIDMIDIARFYLNNITIYEVKKLLTYNIVIISIFKLSEIYFYFINLKYSLWKTHVITQKNSRMYMVIILLFFFVSMIPNWLVRKAEIKNISIISSHITVIEKNINLILQYRNGLSNNKRNDINKNKVYKEKKSEILDAYNQLYKNRYLPMEERNRFYVRYCLLDNLDKIYKNASKNQYQIFYDITHDNINIYKEIFIQNKINISMIDKMRYLEEEARIEKKKENNRTNIELYLYKIQGDIFHDVIRVYLTLTPIKIFPE